MAAQQTGKSDERALIDQFVDLVPRLHYAINAVLDYACPQYSRKVAVALWALSTSPREDEFGKYLTTKELVTTFRDWFVVGESSAASVVSKVKDDFWDLKFIKIESGKDRIRLTEKGEDEVKAIMGRAKELLSDTIAILGEEDQSRLLGYALRMIESRTTQRGATEDNALAGKAPADGARKEPGSVRPTGEPGLQDSSSG